MSRKTPSLLLLVLAAITLLLVAGGSLCLAQPEGSDATTDEGTTTTTKDGSGLKRMGRKKKKVGEKVYASYGLIPHDQDPQRVVEYSKAAVKAASSSAAARRSKKAASSSGRRTADGSEPSAPGTPAKVDLRPYMSPVEDQSQSNSCAANAVAGAYEYLATRAALRDGEETVGDISRLFIYYVGRKRDQYNYGENTFLKPRDEGMTLRGAIEAVQQKGAALQASWPFELDKVNDMPSKAAFEEAMRYKVGDAIKIPLDLDKMRQCLSDGFPIVFGLKLTAAFFYPPYDGFIPTPDPNDPQSASHGLHAMLIVGYNDRQRVFIVRNSWGSGWGVDGNCFLGYDYVANSEFNFVDMYAIQTLTDDDLTPDEDDGHDLHQHVDPSNVTPHFDIEDFHDDGLIYEDEEEEDFDADDMFDNKAEARRAFLKMAGDVSKMSSDNLQLSKKEMAEALKLAGVQTTQEEIDWAFGLYDDDKSGFINFEEFLDMHDLFDGSVLERRRFLNRTKKTIKRWFSKMFGSSSSSGTTEAEQSETAQTNEL